MKWTCKHCKTINESYRSACTKCYRDSEAEQNRKAEAKRRQDDDDDRRRRDEESRRSSDTIFNSGFGSSFGGFDSGPSISCDGGGGGGSGY